MTQRIIHNCHVHTFTTRHVPDDFFPFKLKKLIEGRGSERLAAFLRRLQPHDGDRWDKLAAFLEVGNCGSQLEIFDRLKDFYPPGTRFAVLSMDMEYMGAGRVQSSFLNQVTELAALKRGRPDQILPFIFAHPQRPDLLALVREFIEIHGFQGIKLYPPLGYWPADPSLDPVYAYAEANGIPVMTHCSRGGVYYLGKIDDQKPRRRGLGKPVPFTESNARYTQRYTDPSNYREVLERYPRLRICFGHFGGEAEWKRYLAAAGPRGEDWYSVIRGLMGEYANVYADISSTIQSSDPRFRDLLKVTLQDPLVRTRVLFGSDFYMAERMKTEREFGVSLRAFLNEPDYWQIAEANPMAFLGPLRMPTA